MSSHRSAFLAAAATIWSPQVIADELNLPLAEVEATLAEAAGYGTWHEHSSSLPGLRRFPRYPLPEEVGANGTRGKLAMTFTIQAHEGSSDA